jgi:hypothetical protein
VLKNTVSFVSLARICFIRVGHPEILMLFHPWLPLQFSDLVRYLHPISYLCLLRYPPLAVGQAPPPEQEATATGVRLGFSNLFLRYAGGNVKRSPGAHT